MPKKEKKPKAKVASKTPAKKQTKRKEKPHMSSGTDNQQPPEPQVEQPSATAKPKASPKDGTLDDFVKEAEKWQKVAEEKDLKKIAVKIVECVDISPKGVVIAENMEGFLGSLLFSTIFQSHTGMLEDYRLISPNYKTRHPEFEVMWKNWELLKVMLSEVHPSVKGVMDWKLINRKLKVFARVQAIKMLEPAKSKDLTDGVLTELQRERHDIAVIKECVDFIAKEGVKDGKVGDLRREVSSRRKREKRLKRAEKTNDMVEAMTKSLGYKIRQPPIMFADIGKLDEDQRTALKEQLLVQAKELGQSLQYIKELITYLSVNGKGQKQAEDFVKDFIGEDIVSSISEDSAQEKTTEN